ncbi:MAG: LysM peptidoglycan-binding domain-containing protein [Anaerolineae bacterium]|nr:LysM peptidoglycan-binding domain-containing protein [Anaerolineae bacterium]
MKKDITRRRIRHSLWISTAMALIIITVWVSNAFAQNSTQVKLAPDEAAISVEQTIAMTVQVENIANLYGVEIVITFDPNLLEVVDADPGKPGTQIKTGDFLSGGMEDTNAVADGRIEYIMQQVSPNPPSNGGGVLARITFKGIGSGQADIRIDDLFLSDQGGNGIGCSFQGAQITIQAGSVGGPTPTPFSPTAVPPTATPVPPAPIPQATTAAQPITAQSLGVDCVAVQGYHIVQRGETLYAIARAYATNPYAIVACNPTINPRRIHASNHLAIPYALWPTVPPGPTADRQFSPSLIPAPVPTPTPGCRAYHTVQPYETLTAIGLKYGANIWDIARANRIYNLHFINSGQVLCIP